MNTIQVTKSLVAVLAACLCAVFAQASHAAVFQGFEPGDPVVNPAGDASTQAVFEGVAPPQANHQYLLTSLIGTADNDGFTDVSGNAAVTNAALQAFFNNQFTLTGLRGSGVLIPFTVAAGDTTLSFQYDFLSNQPEQTSPKNDFAFEAIFNSSNNAVQGGPTGSSRFAQVTGTSFTSLGTSPFLDHTGYQTFSINVSSLAPGNYNIGIGLETLSGGSNQHDSGVLLDNFQIGAVPEPSTIAFCLAGAGLLGALRRFKVRRSY